MNNPNNYSCLIVVEGISDVKTYVRLLNQYKSGSAKFWIVSVSGKGFVYNTSTWDVKKVNNDTNNKNCNLLTLIQNDIGRSNFKCIILVVDSDENGIDIFRRYRRNAQLPYISATNPNPKDEGNYWYLDELDGVGKVPIYGICVPSNSTGCLETDLLNSYGFPINGQEEYSYTVDIIHKVSSHWNIPLHGDGKNWWEENERAKMDKFVYSAFSYGF